MQVWHGAIRMKRSTIEKKSSISFLLLYVLNLFIIVLFAWPVQAKKRCKPLLEKLHNVQAMQRNGYSLKRGQSLRAKEDKAREKWWQCENSSRYAKTKKKVSQKSKRKIAKRKENKKRKYKSIEPYKGHPNSLSPFANSGAIIIKSKFKGDKKFAWLTFYQQPAECQRPKSLSAFAICSEDKIAQQLLFEEQYKE